MTADLTAEELLDLYDRTAAYPTIRAAIYEVLVGPDARATMDALDGEAAARPSDGLTGLDVGLLRSVFIQLNLFVDVMPGSRIEDRRADPFPSIAAEYAALARLEPGEGETAQGPSGFAGDPL